MALQDPIAHPALLPECNQPEIQLQIQLWNTVANTFEKYRNTISHPAVLPNMVGGKENTFIKKYREALRLSD